MSNSITFSGDPVADRAAWLTDFAGAPSLEPPSNDAELAAETVRVCARRLGSELMHIACLDGDPSAAAAEVAERETAMAHRHLSAIEDRARHEVERWDLARYASPETEAAERRNVEAAAASGPRALAEHLRARYQSGGLPLALRVAQEHVAMDPRAAQCHEVLTWAQRELVPQQIKAAHAVVQSMPQLRAALESFRGSRR